MKTMSVLELDQHWEVAEKTLKEEREIVVTRDGEAVARLVPMEVEDAVPRKKFDPEENRKRREELWGKGVVIDTLSGLQEDRDDRKLL